MAVENKGEMELPDANYLNVPTGIHFGPAVDDDWNEGPVGGPWEFTADNFMPRKERITQSAYHVIGPGEEIAELIRQYVLPLYREAVGQIEKMSRGEKASLHMWTGKFD